MKAIGYDQFTTMRIRYQDDSYEDIAVIEGDESWWQGNWDSYVNNLIHDCIADDLIKDDWESIMIVIPNWEEDKYVSHIIRVFQEDNKLMHEYFPINE